MDCEDWQRLRMEGRLEGWSTRIFVAGPGGYGNLLRLDGIESDPFGRQSQSRAVERRCPTRELRWDEGRDFEE
jgi:hypothetical protein